MKKSVLIGVGILSFILFLGVKKESRKNSAAKIIEKPRQRSSRQVVMRGIRNPASEDLVAKEKTVKSTTNSQRAVSQEEEKLRALLNSWGDARQAKFLRNTEGNLFKITKVNIDKLTIAPNHILWMANALAQSLEVPLSSHFEDMTSQGGRRIQKFSVGQTVQNSLGQSFKVHNSSLDLIAHRSEQKIIEIHNRLKNYDKLDILPSLTREEAKQLISNSEDIPIAALTVDVEVVAVVDSEKVLQLATVVHSSEPNQPYSYFLSHKTKKIILIETNRIF